MPWEVSQNYIRSGHRNPEEFEPESFRTVVLSEADGIKAVVGKPKGKEGVEIVSYLFDVSKGWTLEKAKEWFSQHYRGGASRGHERFIAVLPFRVLEKIVEKPLRIRGIAMTAGMSRNLNIYLPEELEAFASKLVSAPVYVEHVAASNAVGKVVNTHWDGQNLWYEAEIYDDDVADKIRRGLIRHVSVGADYERLDFLDGKVPRGLHNAELSLVAVPGIPDANIQILERLQAATGQNPRPAASNTINERGKMCTCQNASSRGLTERVWTRRYINSLPDSCFAYVEPGEKDEAGRTVPRIKRHLPFKDAEGRIDLPHLRNALARLNQTKLPEEAKEKARKVLCAAARKVGLKSQLCETEEAKGEDEKGLDAFLVAPEPTLDEVIAGVEAALSEMEEAIQALTARIERLETDTKAAKNGGSLAGGLLVKAARPMIPVEEAARMIKGVLPSPMVERSWGLGPQRLCQELRGILHKLDGMVKQNAGQR